MANDLTDQPWLLDTVSATAVTNDDIRIKHIRWVGATTAGDKATLKDKNARVIWDSTASGANYIEDSLSENQRFFHGLVVTALDHGKLYVYLW